MRGAFWLNTIFALILAFGNLALSMIYYSGSSIRQLSGGTFTRYVTGAREPSQRERVAVKQALDAVLDRAPKGIVGFHEWYVVDDPMPNAWVVGTTLYLTRGVIGVALDTVDDQNHFLPAVIAHELGHLNSTDGLLTLALRRLILPPVFILSQLSGNYMAPGTLLTGGSGNKNDQGAFGSNQVMFTFSLIALFLMILLGLAGGGLGIFLLNPLWTWYWRDREYTADDFAAQCGQAHNLIEYLERYQFFDTATPFFLGSHPYTELRIDKLQAFLGE